jgi:hypothetical protein
MHAQTGCQRQRDQLRSRRWVVRHGGHGRYLALPGALLDGGVPEYVVVGDADVSSAFGGKLKGSERFGAGHWEGDTLGIPYLTDAQANLLCSVGETIRYGTHVVVIGKVEKVRFAEEVSPLIYQDGTYVTTAALAAAAA